MPEEPRKRAGIGNKKKKKSSPGARARSGSLLRRRVALFLVFLLHALAFVSRAAEAETGGGGSAVEYRAIAVSGGLQEGFPDHAKMDYRYQHPASAAAEQGGESGVVRAVFVGRALIRGCKAYLDVMEPGWRQYAPEPDQPLINSVVMLSGCHEHANQYWVYLVDSRQFVSILANEPRFLAVTPDAGLVDLASNETDDAVRHWATHEVLRHELVDDVTALGGMDRSVVALPMVVAVHYHPSFVPSPPIRIHPDGTRVTNFPESLALWAGVNDTDRTANLPGARTTTLEATEKETSPKNAATCESSLPLAHEHHPRRREERYWDGIRAAIRRAEADRPSDEEWKRDGPPYRCRGEARLGTAPDQLRINYPFTPDQLRDIFAAGGYRFESAAGRVAAA